MRWCTRPTIPQGSTWHVCAAGRTQTSLCHAQPTPRATSLHWYRHTSGSPNSCIACMCLRNHNALNAPLNAHQNKQYAKGTMCHHTNTNHQPAVPKAGKLGTPCCEILPQHLQYTPQCATHASQQRMRSWMQHCPRFSWTANENIHPRALGHAQHPPQVPRGYPSRTTEQGHTCHPSSQCRAHAAPHVGIWR